MSVFAHVLLLGKGLDGMWSGGLPALVDNQALGLRQTLVGFLLVYLLSRCHPEHHATWGRLTGTGDECPLTFPGVSPQPSGSSQVLWKCSALPLGLSTDSGWAMPSGWGRHILEQESAVKWCPALLWVNGMPDTTDWFPRWSPEIHFPSILTTTRTHLPVY